ncbi:Ig-like protein group 2 [Dysgonomonas alginatilytica]|uniref:Ig-like protein group 2 n=1 Tax=Dysgonomonas alginatilytica TaxID=1605892 RepID=A0A2V3PWZ3_9BACT|nr:Ig-like domain-containing protein [Dysgonomonas alginatilytica]PXV69108.1 Ig-like protein group 2 [Dysgonomonas alginatilytica]
MKKLIYLLILPFILISCSSDDDTLHSVTIITLEQPDKNIYIGDEYQLTVSHAPIELTAPTYTWESSDPNVAEVNNQGKLTALKEGETTITVKAADLQLNSELKIKVLPIKATSITMSKKEVEIIIDAHHTLTYEIAPKNTTNTEVIWKSSNEKVATVNDGNIKALSVGTATITVTIDGISDECVVTVPKTLFRYKFGATIEQINPTVKISNDFAYNWADISGENPLRAFVFKNNKLTELWNCYGTDKMLSRDYENFLQEVNSLNPPQAVTLENNSDRYARLSKNVDGLTWKNGDYNILIKNGEISIRNTPYPMLIIQYTEIK